PCTLPHSSRPIPGRAFRRSSWHLPLNRLNPHYNFIGTHFALDAKVAPDPAPPSQLRPAAAEDGRLENLQIAVDVGETDVTEPCALLLDRRQDVGILVRAVIVKPGHIVAALGRVMAVERVDEHLVLQRTEPYGGRGYMLDVDEDPARVQQSEDLAVDRQLPVIRLMVDGEARDDGIVRGPPGDGACPGWDAVIGQDKVGQSAGSGASLPGGLQHRLREVRQHDFSPRQALKDCQTEDAIAATKVEHPSHGPPAAGDETE